MAEIITISVKTNGVDKAIKSLERIQELCLSIGKTMPFAPLGDGLDKTTRQTENYTQTVKNTATATQSLGSMIAKNASWYLISGAVSKATGAIQDAISTMKAVDDELVTVRKVTGATTEEMARLESQAYGVAANEYLSSVAAFSRAGYGDAAAGLAELSTKTQIVGDTNAETANQFLLSVDAAYKYQGSIEKLSAVLDGANELDNKYATSIENIAEGMGIVAPVAAQAKVGVDELAAALGTITAVTQRSGSEAARAFRALILNIMGDTTTMFETETGELTHYTADEVAGLQQVVQEYAGTALEAAKATGEVVNPMEVMAALAQSVKDGFLTEAEFMKTVTDISGKLRSSQMFALIQNWDMYESMLADFGGAVGSADAEVANAMDSWTRKTEILKNTWTEFLSGTNIQGLITGMVEVGTVFLKVANNDIAQFIVKAGALYLAFSQVEKGASALKSTIGSWAQNGVDFFSGIMQGIKVVTTGMSGMEAATTAVSAVWSVIPFAGKAAIAVAAIAGIVKIADKLVVTLNEAKDAVIDANEQYEALTDQNGEYAQLAARADELTTAEKARLTVLKMEVEEAEKLRKLKAEEFQNKYTKGSTFFSLSEESIAESRIRNYRENTKRYNELLKAANPNSKEDAQAIEAAAESLQASRAMIVESYNLLAEISPDGSLFTGATKEVFDDLQELILGFDEGTEAAEKFAEAQEGAADAGEDVTESLTEQTRAAKELEQAINGSKDALEAYENAKSGPEHGDTFKSYAEMYQDAMDLFNKGLTGTNQFRAAAELLLPEDVLASLGYNYQKAGEMLNSDFWRAVFADNGEDYGANFANRLKNDADEFGRYLSESGELLATFKEDADGTFTMLVKDVEGLAEALGTTPEVIESIIDAVDAFSAEIEYSGEEALAIAESLNGVLTEIPGNVHQIDLTAFIEQLAEAGYSTDKIYGLVAALQELDGVSITNPPEDLNATIAAAQEAQTATDSTKAAVDELGASEAKPTIEVDNSAALAGIRQVKSMLEALDGKTVTTTIVTNNVTETGATASGTKNASPGPSVVNEEGPELILSGDRAYIAGGGKPAMTTLHAGDVVYTAQETREILARQGQEKTFPRFARGIPTNQYSNKYSYSSSSSSKGKGGASAGFDAEKLIEELEKFLKGEEHQIFLWEREGGKENDIIAKYKELQDKLHETAEELRQHESELTDEQIQELQKKWWAYADEIEDVYEAIAKAQKELWDELEDAIDDRLKEAKKARDSEIEAIDDYIEQLRKRNKEEKKELELQEKQNAVLEAQNKLRDAQNERTVRVYNAETNQWDWMARPDEIDSAQKALDEAQKDLDEYVKELALEEEIEALERRKAAIQNSYDAFEAEWEKIRESIEEPGRDISEILADIAQNGAPRMQAAVDSVASILERLGNYQTAAVGKGTGPSVAQGNWSNRDYTNDTTDYSQLMMDATDWEAVLTYGEWRDQKAAAQGIDYAANGWKTTEQIKEEWWQANGGKYHVYDSGGILRGMGGIKATDRDEAVLGPDLTAALLNPGSDAVFAQRVRELGYLYGERADGSVLPAGAITNNKTGDTNNYGGPYYFNGIEIGAREAETMTLSDLARQLKVLSLYTNR